MTEAQANLNISKREDINVVMFEDRKILEELTINTILERLSDIVGGEDQPKLMLDFQKVEHLSSAALGILITLNKQVTQRKGQMVLANIHPQIFEVFKITRLNKLFNIQNTTTDALKQFN